MNLFVQETVRGIESRDRNGARKVLWRALLDVSGVLSGLAGLGFVIASAFLALSTAVGPILAALLLGFGLLGLAGGLLALANRPRSRPVVAEASESGHAPSETDVPQTASLVAFTAAFVLGRYLVGSGRD